MKPTKYQKMDESDGQMLIRIAKKFVALFIIIFLFDFLIDVLSTLLDYFIEFVHLVIEFFEYSLESLLEYFLESMPYESEIILVNFVLLITAYLLFRLYFNMPRLYRWLSRWIKAAWLRHKRKKMAYWKSLSLIRKIKIMTTYGVGIVCILFFVTL